MFLSETYPGDYLGFWFSSNDTSFQHHSPPPQSWKVTKQILEFSPSIIRFSLIALAALRSYAALNLIKEKGAFTHMVANGVILFIGGVAAIIILRLLLFLFWGKSFRKTGDDQYLKRIADALQ